MTNDIKPQTGYADAPDDPISEPFTVRIPMPQGIDFRFNRLYIAPPRRLRTRRRATMAFVLFAAAILAPILIFVPGVPLRDVADRNPAAAPAASAKVGTIEARATLPPALTPEQRAHVDAVFKTVFAQLNPGTHLANSFTGDSRLRYWSVVYDNAMRIIAHAQIGQVDVARKAMDYFLENPGIRMTGYVVRDGRRIAVPGWIINIVDASEKRFGGRGVEHIAHVGPNAYLGLAAIHLYRRTNDPAYLAFARDRWKLLKTLQNEDPSDPNYGGIRMGPLGSSDNPYIQKLEFKKENPSFYHFYNGEHAADFKALSDLMAKIDPAGAVRYANASRLIEVWDRNIYDADKHLFYIGTTEKRYFDNNIGRWIEPGIIPMHPLDTSALKLSGYGVEGLEAFEPGAAEKIRQAIDENFRVTVTFNAGPGGEERTATGYDFVTHGDRASLIRWIEEGRFHDRKVDKGRGRAPILSDEWSTWVALADLRLSSDFAARGESEKAARFLERYRQNALVNGMKTAIELEPGRLAYPYAHPLPNSLNQPVGFGWNTHHAPYAVIAGVSRTLGMLRFDPFLLDGGPYAISASLPAHPPAPAVAVRPDGVLYTEAELYVERAWIHANRALKAGAAEGRHWRRALRTVERMFAEHPDWKAIAAYQNKEAAKAGDRFPLKGIDGLTDADVFPIFKKYWALYHVGTAEFIRVMAAARLAELARAEGKMNAYTRYRVAAARAAEEVRSRFYLAQTFDRRGWFWQPVDSLSQYL